LLRAIDELLHGANVAVSFGRNALACPDELAKTPLFMHDLRMRAHVRDGRCRIHELRQVTRATDLSDPLATTKPRRNRGDVNRGALGRELHGRFENAPVGVAVEMLGLEQLEDTIERVAFEKNRCEHGSFGIEVMRRNSARDRNRFVLLRTASAPLGLHVHFFTRSPQVIPSFSTRRGSKWETPRRQIPSRRRDESEKISGNSRMYHHERWSSNGA
jgi:hypothetical protein